MSHSGNLQTQFAKILRAMREKAGYSQEELADRAGLHRTYISQIERGLKSPSLNSLVGIARALGVRISELFVDLDDQ